MEPCKVTLVHFLKAILLLNFLAQSEWCVQCANILGLMGVSSPSHHLWNSVLLHELGVRGHNVTILSVDLPKAHQKVPKNVHYIHLETGYDMYKIEDKQHQVDVTQYIGLSSYETVISCYEFSYTIAYLIAQSKGMQTLLNYPSNFPFNLIIYDYSLGPQLLGFAHKFNYPPIVGISAFHNPPITIDIMSNHYFPAYVPYYSTSYGSEMDFWQRFTNTAVFALDVVYRRFFFLPKLDALMRPYFPKDMPSLSDIGSRTAIAIVNSHPAVNYAESLPPSIIEVGGMQMQDVSPLASDVDSFIQNGTRGAILFSLGTNLKSQDTTADKIQAILETFARFPEFNFIWKFDREYLKDFEKLKPSNVMIKSFLQQKSILGHPKLKVFVTHCGGLSVQEATWHGVPMVGIPLFFDQHRNFREAMLAGLIVKVDYITMTADSLTDAIQRVLQDKQMIANAKRRSARFRDRPMQPRDTAVWWIEYLLREPKPTHLKSPAANLNYFQAHSLDVILFVSASLSALIFTFYRCFISD